MTILANAYQTTGTSQAITVPFQSKPFLGMVFIQYAGGTIGSSNLSPSWGAPPASSGSGGAAAVFVHAFNDPVSSSDALLTPTVGGGITGGPLLVIAMSVSRDGTDIYNVSHHDVQSGTAWSGNLVPATGNVKENTPPWLSSDIETLAFTTAFLTNTVVGTVDVTPTAPMTEIAEVAATGQRWAIEVCRDTAANGTDKHVVVDGTYHDDGTGIHDSTQRISGAVFTFHISSTFVRSPDGWHLGSIAAGPYWA